jgi:hypothetical protein
MQEIPPLYVSHMHLDFEWRKIRLGLSPPGTAATKNSAPETRVERMIQRRVGKAEQSTRLADSPFQQLDARPKMEA